MNPPDVCQLCDGRGVIYERDAAGDLWGKPCRCSRGQAKRPAFDANTAYLKRIGAPLHPDKPKAE